MPQFKIKLKSSTPGKFWRYTINAPDKESAVKKARQEAMRAKAKGHRP